MVKLWHVKLLFILLLDNGPLNLLQVRGSTLRTTHFSSQNEPREQNPQEKLSDLVLLSRGIRDVKSDGDTERTCGQRLLYRVLEICNSPFVNFIRAGGRVKRHQEQEGYPNSNSYEETRLEGMGSEAEKIAKFNLIHSQQNSPTRYKHVVEECCFNSCNPSQLVKYCPVSQRPSSFVVPTAAPTAAPTTTTTLAPAEERVSESQLIKGILRFLGWWTKPTPSTTPKPSEPSPSYLQVENPDSPFRKGEKAKGVWVRVVAEDNILEGNTTFIRFSEKK